jgi:hypothetical protein
MSIFNAGRNALGLSTVPNPEHPIFRSHNSRRGKTLTHLGKVCRVKNQGLLFGLGSAAREDFCRVT